MPSPNSSIISPANDLSLQALLTLSSIAAILDIFVNKHVTLTVIVLVDPTNNLPMSQAYSYDSTDTPVQALQTIMTEISSANLNLTEPEKELL
jgi:hypothetical protein